MRWFSSPRLRPDASAAIHQNRSMQIKVDDLTGAKIVRLLEFHVQNLSSITPAGSCHVLNLDALRKPNITFWSAWEGDELLGCGALKELDSFHAEVKSMRTAPDHLRKGVASHLLEHIIAEARRRNYCRLSLETGSAPPFHPAQALYSKYGFRRCGPFADYTDDPNSMYMTLEL